MEEHVPLANNRLGLLLDRLVGQSSTTAGHAGDLGTDRRNHSVVQSEHLGRLIQMLTLGVQEMAYGTFTSGAVDVTTTGLNFRPDFVFLVNIGDAGGVPALGVYVRGMPADSLWTFAAAAVFNVLLTGITLADAGFTLDGGELVVNNAAGDTCFWVAVGHGGPAT